MNASHVVRTTMMLSLALAMTLNAGRAFAWQPEDGPPPVRGNAGPQAAMRALLNESDPERVRRMLDEMLNETRQFERDLSGAVERLNKGDDTRDVLRELGERRQAAREGIRERVADRMAERGRQGEELRDGPRGPAGPEGRRGGDRFFKPGNFAKLSQEERDQLREDFRRDLPDVAADLELLRTTNREMAENIFSRIGPRYFEAREIRRIDPELATLRIAEIRGTVDVLRKTRAYRDAVKLPGSDANRAAAITQATANLREAIARNFDERLAVQKHEADALAKRLDELRADIASKGERKDALVDDALDRMVRGLPPQMDEKGPREGPGGPGGPPGRDRP